MGKEALEHAKVTADSEPAKARPRDHEGSDRLGTLAKPESITDEEWIKRSITNVEHSYHWFAKAATQKLTGLREELKKEDEPDWFSTIAQGLFEMAIGAGAAGAGAHLAKKLAKNAGEGVTEFVKVMLEGGLGAGIAAGRDKLRPGKDKHVVDPFMDAQIEALDKTADENQSQFMMIGRDKIDTVAKADAIRAACTQDHAKEAAQVQYEVSRDAWLSYLAQTKFGAISSNGGAVQPDAHDKGSTTTNMSNRDHRKRTNKHAPGFVPEEAPEFRKALQGDADGVLTVAVRLPSIVAGLQMTGRPTVEHAFLNGVNGAIREQYENQSLGSLHIPRQVAVAIEGTAQRFEFGVNEKGELADVPRTGALHDWLVARSTVAHPENASKSDFGKVMEGTRLLLDDLVATSIKK